MLLKKSYTFLISAVILAVVFFLLFDWFLSYSVDRLEAPVIMSNSPQMIPHILFAMSGALLIGLWWLLIRLGKINSNGPAVFALVILVAGGIATWQMRLYMLNAQIANASKLAPESITTTVSFENLHLHYYLMGGMVGGALVAWWFFKVMNRKPIIDRDMLDR